MKAWSSAWWQALQPALRLSKAAVNAALFLPSTAFCSAASGRADVLFHNIAAEHGAHIVETVAQLADLVIGERPVPGMAGKP